MNRIFPLHFLTSFFTSFFTSFCIISYLLYENLPAPPPPPTAVAAENHGLIVYAEMYTLFFRFILSPL